MAVDRHEMKGSPTEEWTQDGLYAICQWWCAWGDRYTLLTEIGTGLGELYQHNTGSGARAYAASVKPFGKQSRAGPGKASYVKALVTAKYTNAINYTEGENGILITEALQPHKEFITMPHEDAAGEPLLYWDASQETAVSGDEAPGLQLCGNDYIVTYHHVSAIPSGVATAALYNCCNNASVASYTLGLTFPAESLLFPGATAVRTIKLGSTNDWQLSYRFSIRAVGWNKHWNARTATFGYIYDASGQIVRGHPLGSFASLVPS
jgi:hypothetical protein